MSKPPRDHHHHRISKSPTNLHKIPPLIKNSAEWKLYSSSNITSINKYRPKMLSKIHISLLNSEELVQFIETRNLRRVLIATKSVFSLRLDGDQYQNGWQLERILSFTNHLQKLNLSYSRIYDHNLNVEAVKKITRLGRYRNLSKLILLSDFLIETQEKVLKSLAQQIPQLRNLKTLVLNSDYYSSREVPECNLNIQILKIKPTRSLTTLSLEFAQGPFPDDLLSNFTSNIQKCSQLENLTLNFSGVDSNITFSEALLWSSCFENMQNLKTLTVMREIFPNQPLEGTEIFLKGFKNLENLVALNLRLRPYGHKIKPIILLNASLSNHLKCLDLGFPSSPQENFQVFLTNLQLFAQLEKLHLKFPGLDMNNLILDNISQALHPLKDIKDLKIYLFAKNITYEGIISFAQALKQLIHLTILDLRFSESNLDYDSLEALSNSLATLSLTSLRLILTQPNKPKPKPETQKDLIPLFSAISGFKELSSLNLSLQTFDFSTKEMKSFSEGLKKLERLSDLSLELPQFDLADDFQGLQKFLSSLVSLTSHSDDEQKKNLISVRLTFAGKKFSRQEFGFIISAFEKCNSLESLHLTFVHAKDVKKKALYLLLPAFRGLISLRNLTIEFKRLSVSGEDIFRKFIKGLRFSLKNLKEICILDNCEKYMEI